MPATFEAISGSAKHIWEFEQMRRAIDIGQVSHFANQSNCHRPSRGREAMKASLRPGVSRTSLLTVDRDRSIGFMGEEGRVYGTPFLVRDIEQTCRELLLEYGDAGEDSVGTDIAIKHVAPTLLGTSVEIKVIVSVVDGHKVSF